MIDLIQLAAIVIEGAERKLMRLPLAQNVQRVVTELWNQQFETLISGTERVTYEPGYNTEDGEVFEIDRFEPPEWFDDVSSESLRNLDVLPRHEDALLHIKGLAAFTKLGAKSIVLFQNFSRSHIIRPGFSLLLGRDTYKSIEEPGLTMGDRLAGVWYRDDEKLVFASFRAINVIVPLSEYYREASEQEIRRILANPVLAPENVAAIAVDASQWMQKRFALLADSDVLTKFKPRAIQNRGKNFDVQVRLKDGKIVFPADKTEAKRLLQFLNEEIFLGAISGTRFATNSKRIDA